MEQYILKVENLILRFGNLVALSGVSMVVNQDEILAIIGPNEDIKEFYLGLSYVGKRKSYREVKHYKRRKRWLA